jgi:hypothetical protein
MMLKWIRNHFPQMRIVFMMRHPHAVAASRTRLQWRTDVQRVYFAQKELMLDHLDPFTSEIDRASSPFEKHVVDWCVENLIPFRQLENGDVYLIFYEHLLENPRVELQRLLSYLNRPYQESIMSHLKRPSMSTPPENYECKSMRTSVLRRQEPSDAQEILLSRRIVKAFGLDKIYNDAGMPNMASMEWRSFPTVTRLH